MPIAPAAWNRSYSRWARPSRAAWASTRAAPMSSPPPRPSAAASATSAIASRSGMRRFSVSHSSRSTPDAYRPVRCVREALTISGDGAGASTPVKVAVLPSAFVILDELVAALEDGLGVVVEGGHVVTIRQLTHGDAVLGQSGKQRLHAGRADYVVDHAAVHQHWLADLPQPFYRRAPEFGQGGRGTDRHPVVAGLGRSGLLDVA